MVDGHQKDQSPIAPRRRSNADTRPRDPGEWIHRPMAKYRKDIDTDLYQPTIDCLDYFGPRLTSGGVVIIDDCASKKCPGVPRAVVEYLARTAAFHAWDMRTEQLMLLKR